MLGGPPTRSGFPPPSGRVTPPRCGLVLLRRSHLWTRLGGFPPNEPFTMWMTAVIGLNFVSLVIDVSDVWRYIGGERTPHLTAG